MSYRALVSHFRNTSDLPIKIDDVANWIRTNTDHKEIGFYGVSRAKKAFRGAFRRRELPITLAAYNHNADHTVIFTDVLYGEDLPEDWKRLVMCKELLHVFDPPGAWVNTVEKLRKLVPAVITPELGSAPFMPAVEDHLGAYKALAILLPEQARIRIEAVVTAGDRTVPEVAAYLQIPAVYVDIWLRLGAELEQPISEWYG